MMAKEQFVKNRKLDLPYTEVLDYSYSREINLEDLFKRIEELKRNKTIEKIRLVAEEGYDADSFNGYQILFETKRTQEQIDRLYKEYVDMENYKKNLVKENKEKQEQEEKRLYKRLHKKYGDKNG